MSANIIEGSVRKSGNRVRVTNPADSVPRWREHLVADITIGSAGCFQVQDQIAAPCARAKKVKLAPGNELQRAPKPNLDAYERIPAWSGNSSIISHFDGFQTGQPGPPSAPRALPPGAPPAPRRPPPPVPDAYRRATELDRAMRGFCGVGPVGVLRCRRVRRCRRQAASLVGSR